MRVKFAMIVIMPVAVIMFVIVLIGSQGLDAGSGFGRGHFALLHRALQLGFFQPQAVEQHQSGFTDFFDVAAGEVIRMCILISPHQALHHHPLAADLLRHITQNAEAHHHRHRRGIKCARP